MFRVGGRSGKGASRKSANAEPETTDVIAPPMDWQCGKSLPECLGHLLSSNIASDVIFVVGEEKEIVRAHKLILISRSPVFYAMLEGPMSEKGEITIPDITKNIFCAFLKYLYTDSLALEVSNAVPILAAARKYCVDRLVNECEKYIQSNLTADTASMFLEEAHVFMEDNIKSKCLECLKKRPSAFLQSGGFSQLCQTCFESITASDDLDVEENTVFEAVTKWSKAECERKNLEATDENKRKVLGSALYTVRFPLLSEQYFNKNVLPSNLLTSDEIVMIYRHWHSSGSLTNSKFTTKKRERKIKICRNCRICKEVCYNCGEHLTDDLTCYNCGYTHYECNNCRNVIRPCQTCGSWDDKVCGNCGTVTNVHCYHCGANPVCQSCGNE